MSSVSQSWLCIATLFALTFAVAAQPSVQWIGFNAETAPGRCDAGGGTGNCAYLNDTCRNECGSAGYYARFDWTTGTDGVSVDAITYNDWTSSTCAGTASSSGTLMSNSWGRCIPTYKASGAYNFGMVVWSTEVAAGPQVTPYPYPDTGASYPLSADVNVTNVQWFRNTNCSGTPYQTVDSMPNDGCVVGGVGLGVARALSCRIDDPREPPVQWVASWAGASNCPRTAPGASPKESFNGLRLSNPGQCITVFLSSHPFGSVRFTCPSAVPSSSTGGGQSAVSSTAISGGTAAASGTIQPEPSSSTGSAGSIDSSTGPNVDGASTGNPFSSASSHVPRILILLVLSAIMLVVSTV